MHCPSLPAIAHERQVPVHAVAQQTPVTQKPDAQSAAAAQAAPGGFGPQLPFTHAAPPTQSASAAQSARHAAPACVAHVRAARIAAGGAAHARAVAAGGVAHRRIRRTIARGRIAPAGYSAHAPVPSQKPLRPQLARPSSGQSPRGSAPTGTLVQVPTLPSTVHD